LKDFHIIVMILTLLSVFNIIKYIQNKTYQSNKGRNLGNFAEAGRFSFLARGRIIKNSMSAVAVGRRVGQATAAPATALAAAGATWPPVTSNQGPSGHPSRMREASEVRGRGGGNSSYWMCGHPPCSHRNLGRVGTPCGRPGCPSRLKHGR
jgi:hypothetical protein